MEAHEAAQLSPGSYQSATNKRANTSNDEITPHKRQLTARSQLETLERSAAPFNTTTTSLQKQQPPFFRLPAELRNVIYEDILGDLGNAFRCFGGLSYIQHCHIGLLFVNRQIYSETRLLPYSLNPITGGPRFNLQGWLQRRSKEQLHAISKLHFVFDLPGNEDPRATFENALAKEKFLAEPLEFSGLTGLRHILVEMQSPAIGIVEIFEQIKMLEETKRDIERRHPQVNVTVELHCFGAFLRRALIPASSTTQVRIMRFYKLWEGEGLSVYDILKREGLYEFCMQSAVEG
jgi:hypothetical protein